MDKSTFMAHAREIFDLHESKSGDYGSERDYFPFEDKSYVQMLHVKTQRLVALNVSEDTPNHESLKDSVKDLINYAFFYLDFLENPDGA